MGSFKFIPKKILLLGSGELGKELVVEAKRLGLEVIAIDKYENAPAMQLADNSFVIDMSDKKILKNKIDLIEVSYRYLLNNPALSEIILGCKNIDQLNCALIAINKGPLNKEMYKELKIGQIT